MGYIVEQGLTYRLTSRRNGGQYAGPCLFTGDGNDRFTIEPARGNWFCRQCSYSCQHGVGSSGGMRYGKLDAPIKKYQEITYMTSNQISPEIALEMHGSLTNEARAYLLSRGITRRTIDHLKLGSAQKVFITFPLLYHWKGELKCPAIKRRWIPKYKPEDSPSYLAIEGSRCKGLYNFDAVDGSSKWGCVANSLIDVVTLVELGIPVVGPFAGESSWEPAWGKLLWPDLIINFGDLDPPKTKKDGTVWHPGEFYMLQRAVTLQAKQVINVYPPGGHTDLNAAYMAGEDVVSYIKEKKNEAIQESAVAARA